MISERQFAARHQSFWRGIAPLLEQFLRRLNLDYIRDVPPIVTSSDPLRRGLINELAFNIYEISVLENKIVGELNIKTKKINEMVSKTEDYIQGLGSHMNGRTTSNELREAVLVASQLEMMVRFYRQPGKLVVRPSFTGCGYIESCHGDILDGSCLLEVKAGERHFRSSDLKQILVYAALNHASREHEVGELGLLNPRVGISFRAPVEFVVKGIGGVSPSDFFDNMVFHISGAEVSR